MMKLIGSKTSPFVRRIRLQLGTQPYEFETVDVYTEPERSKVTSRNPAGRVPVFIDADKVLWDSRLITRHLLERQKAPLPSLETELELDVVDNATDTGVLLFQIRKFGLDEKWENKFCRLQVDRLDRLLTVIADRPSPQWGT